MNNANSRILYSSGGAELLDDIQSLWEKLNRHHETISPYFSQDFRDHVFSARKAKLLKKYSGGELHLDLAHLDGGNIGYIISAVTDDDIGEIESIFVKSEFRGQTIGDELMHRALNWLDEQNVHTKVIVVAVGNERAYSFYARFGFYPRVVMLKQKEYA